MADFDVQGARKAGYSDKEIADHLATEMKFDAAAARKSGYKDSDIIEHLAPGPGLVSRAASAVVGGAADVADWLSTRGTKAGANIVGLPKAISQGFDWASEKTGLPKAAFGPAAWLTAPAGLPGVAGGAEYEKFVRDNPYVNIGPGALLQHFARAAKGGTTTPETNLPGVPGKVVDASVEALLSAPFGGSVSAPALAATVGGGALSETAGQVAKVVAPEYETEARLFGGGVGALTGAKIPSVVRKGVDVAKTAAAPFSAEGRASIAGTALRNAAADPDTALANIGKYQIGREAFPDAVPGFKIDAGKASRDPGLMAVAETAAPKRPGMAAQVQLNNALATKALDDAFAGLPSGTDAGDIVQRTLADRFKTLVEARSAAADPHYTAARASTTPVDPTDALTFARQVADEGKGKPAKLMKEVAGYIESGADTPKKLMATRDAVGTLLDNPKLDPYRKSLLLEVRRKIDDALSVVPEEQAARSTFQQYSQPLDPFSGKTTAGAIVKKDRFGKDFVQPAGKATGDLSDRAIQNIMMASGGDPAVKKALQSAFFEDFKKAARSSVQEDATGNKMLLPAGSSKWLEKNRAAASNILTPDQVMALDDIARNLRDQAQTVPGRTGAPTFDRLASESILGALVGKRFGESTLLQPVRRALGLVYGGAGGADEAVMNIIFDVISDPAAAAALMKKATPGNVKMIEPLLQNFARGAAVPALTAGGRESP